VSSTGSGFFVNDAGHIVTARHVVEHCRLLYGEQRAQVVRAELIATSSSEDLALVRSGLKPLLAATLAGARWPRLSRSQARAFGAS
jgi:S1-C subfamily serine protease